MKLVFLLNISDMNVLTAVLSVVLLLTMELIVNSPSISYVILDKRKFRTSTIFVCFTFFIILVIRSYQLLIFHN